MIVIRHYRGLDQQYALVDAYETIKVFEDGPYVSQARADYACGYQSPHYPVPTCRSPRP